MGNGGFFKVEGRGIMQDLSPCVGQLKVANIPVEGWIIDPDVHGLLNGPCDVVHLPTLNGEVVHTAVMTCGVGMVKVGEGAQRCFPSLSPKVLVDSFIYSLSDSSLLHLYL